MNNSRWAHSLIDQLIQQGVRHFCVAPGSRSAPLALAAKRHKKAKVFVHFDERSLGFFALGLSMASIPAAIIVTSGSAVGNLLPSVMEASHSFVPLIVLSADRPPELKDCSALQSTDQIKIFQNFTLWQADLPCPESFQDDRFIRSQSAYAVKQAMQGGPVHINCPFREPLYEPCQRFEKGKTQVFFEPSQEINSKTIRHVEKLLKNAKRGLMIIGNGPSSQIKSILNWAKNNRWPVFADLLSNARMTPTNEQIRHYDLAIAQKAFQKPDLIIHFGGTFISKALIEWLDEIRVPIIQISENTQRIDPDHHRPHRMHANPMAFCRLIQGIPSNLLSEYRSIDTQLHGAIEKSFSSSHSFSQDALMRYFGQKLPANWIVFFGNSTPIRTADLFFFPSRAKAFFANRGLSGIDGQIATSAGIATLFNSPMLSIVGDIGALHDLNSFALLKKIKTPFLLVIINNFGGAIFSKLPIAQEKEHFDELFKAAHSYRFDKIAKMFSIPYFSAKSIHELDHFNISQPTILEVFTKNECLE